MLTYDFNFLAKGLDGTEFTGLNLSKHLAEGLAYAKPLANGSALAHSAWAVKLFVGEAINLEKKESDYLKEFILNGKHNINALFAIQLVNYIDSVKPE